MTAETLPLESPNWLPIEEEVYARLLPLYGSRNGHLAVYDLTTVFAGLSRKPYVRTLRRWYKRPDRARVNDPRLWAVKFELKLDNWSGGVCVAYRVHDVARRRIHWVRTLVGYSFYAWLPDLAEVWPSVFASAPTPPVKVELGPTKVQLVSEKPKPRAKAQSPSQTTEEQIQELMGDVSKLTDAPKKIRRYAVLKYGARWKEIDPAQVLKDAQGDKLYEEVVGPLHHISTFRRGLRGKK